MTRTRRHNASSRTSIEPESTHPVTTGDGASERPQVSLDVAVRAYELYEQRGKEDGHDWEDWLRAEQEVRAGTNGHIPRPPHHE